MVYGVCLTESNSTAARTPDQCARGATCQQWAERRAAARMCSASGRHGSDTPGSLDSADWTVGVRVVLVEAGTSYACHQLEN